MHLTIVLFAVLAASILCPVSYLTSAYPLPTSETLTTFSAKLWTSGSGILDRYVPPEPEPTNSVTPVLHSASREPREPLLAVDASTKTKSIVKRDDAGIAPPQSPSTSPSSTAGSVTNGLDESSRRKLQMPKTKHEYTFIDDAGSGAGPFDRDYDNDKPISVLLAA